MTTATKSHPILFSGPMVRAILDGRKTMTRRAIKPQPSHRHLGYMAVAGGALQCGADYPDGDDDFVKCPYGSVGDRLWVRENFWIDVRSDGEVIYDATPEYGKYKNTGEVVRSTCPDGYLPSREECRIAMLPKFWKCKPSIHMPRWASRITLEVTGVRVERLNEITEEDAKAEGINAVYRSGSDEPTYIDGPGGFRYLWESINGKGSWQLNPWVWCVSFRRIEPVKEEA